jgi:hypothetical protein
VTAPYGSASGTGSGYSNEAGYGHEARYGDEPAPTNGPAGYAQVDTAGFAPVPPRTGNARIDETLGALAAAGDAPPDQLVAPLTEADRALREALDSIGDD